MKNNGGFMKKSRPAGWRSLIRILKDMHL